MKMMNRFARAAGVGLLLLASSVRADVVSDWNVTALRTTAAAPFNPPLESRNLAIVHAAIFDAVNAIGREFEPYAVWVEPARPVSPEAAASAAAHLALLRLYPAQQASLDAAHVASLAAIPDGPAKIHGIALGESVAARILTLRESDGAGRATEAPGPGPSGPGFWVPTPPAFLPALDPGWGSVTPFVLKRGCQFRPAAPPPLSSARYLIDFEEIKAIGSAGSATRTAAQSDLARFWIATGPQNWNPAARQVAATRRIGLLQNARLFALLNLAGADAFISAWDAKFAYHQWRPVTAIRVAETDGNPGTGADPSWTPLLVTPPFPDYPAGHTTYAGAAERVLEDAFGVRPGVTLALTSPTAPGLVESYVTFRDIARGVVDARVWGGIHWRTSSEVGLHVGEKIGRYVVRHALRPRGTHSSDEVANREEGESE
jgi:hypothetical protein